MLTITKGHLRSARKKRAERKRKTAVRLTLLAGVGFVSLATGLSFFYAEDTKDPYAGMRCLQMQENEAGFEECIKWEREKTTRSKVVQQHPPADTR